MSHRLIVTMNSGSYHETIYIDVPNDNDTVDLDFNGQFLIQCIYEDGEFLPTGNGINGGGYPLNSVFFEHLVISLRVE